jgi:hypothetical protein
MAERGTLSAGSDQTHGNAVDAMRGAQRKAPTLRIEHAPKVAVGDWEGLCRHNGPVSLIDAPSHRVVMAGVLERGFGGKFWKLHFIVLAGRSCVKRRLVMTWSEKTCAFNNRRWP